MSQTELDLVNSKNTRLLEENAFLKHKLNDLLAEKHSSPKASVEAKIKAFALENERDQMYENLERLKKKYNKLNDAYLEKVKHCRALEETFRRQKTLTGLVTKLANKQQHKEQEVVVQKPAQHSQSPSNADDLQIVKLKESLKDAHDIIDELEFELESIDYLEAENQRMREELHALKNIHAEETASIRSKLQNSTASRSNSMLCRHMVVSSICNDCCLDEDVDNATLEKTVLTDNLIQMAEAESNCLRRELLKSRLQNAARQKQL